METKSRLSRWSARIFLDPSKGEPLYLQIASAIARDIEKGRLQPGEALAGYRTLAQELGVNRNTVLAAMQELVAQGLIVSKPGEGSTVALAPPGGIAVAPARAAQRPASAARDVMEAASGVPDPRLLPTAALSRAYREAAKLLQKRKSGADDPQGSSRLRAVLAKLLSDLRGVEADPARLLITAGGPSALTLVGQLLAHRGTLAVESPGARASWDALRQAGAVLAAVPVDEQGLDVEALARLSKKTKLSAVLLSPQRHYPTLAVLEDGRRRALLELARKRDFLVLESDPDPEFQFNGAPRAALASEDPERVLYLGTLSRVFSPGVRLSLLRAPAALLPELARLRLLQGQSDVLLELAMAELIENGELQRHVNRTKKIYQGRRDALAVSLARHLPGSVSFELPRGGLAFWLRTAPHLDVDAWAERARERGAVFRPGSEFSFEGKPLAGMRLGFSSHAETELDDLARRLALALPGPAAR